MDDRGYNIIKRGAINVKGKGLMTTYFVLGNTLNPNIIFIEQLEDYISQEMGENKETEVSDNREEILKDEKVNNMKNGVTNNGHVTTVIDKPIISKEKDSISVHSKQQEVRDAIATQLCEDSKDSVRQLWQKNKTTRSQYCVIL